jgi:Zn-dependent protease
VVPEVYAHLALFIVELNCVLAVFNLIPLWPLDGSHVLVGILPRDAARQVSLFYQRYGMTPLLVFFVATMVLNVPIIEYPINLLVRVIVGG